MGVLNRSIARGSRVWSIWCTAAMPRSQLCLQVKTSHARSKRGQVIGLIHAIQATHMPEINSQDRSIACNGIDVTDNAGTPTIWNQLGADLTRIAHQVTYLILTFRIGNAVRKAINTPAAQGNPIG